MAVQVVALSVYLDDQRYLTELFDRIAIPSLPPSEQVKGAIAFLRQKPAITNNSYCLLPIFGFLRPTARQVAEEGGDCGDRSRLLVSLLRLRGIKAAKWALYSSDMHPQHAVVEVEVESGKMVVDPLFGLWFPRPGAGYYGVKDLKEKPGILQARIGYLRLHGEQPGAARLEFYSLSRYVYDNPRTINWDNSIVRQLLYRILYWMMGERLHEIPRPALGEEPALMIVLGLMILESSVLVAWVLTARLSNRKGSKIGMFTAGNWGG
jgi:hypothetical protein